VPHLIFAWLPNRQAPAGHASSVSAYHWGRFRSNAPLPLEREIDDPDGVVLPSDAAAIEYARRIIDDLGKIAGQRTPKRPSS
jgi:hypothetical protein